MCGFVILTGESLPANMAAETNKEKKCYGEF